MPGPATTRLTKALARSGGLIALRALLACAEFKVEFDLPLPIPLSWIPHRIHSTLSAPRVQGFVETRETNSFPQTATGQRPRRVRPVFESRSVTGFRACVMSRGPSHHQVTTFSGIAIRSSSGGTWKERGSGSPSKSRRASGFFRRRFPLSFSPGIKKGPTPPARAGRAGPRGVLSIRRSSTVYFFAAAYLSFIVSYHVWIPA